ncbi:hypothetical protein PPYR_09549 [Photinus pyralis]|uniref:Protein hunchback n=3 Tax=Photinus pyralis TaxID=7054 RepID=A0A5N4AMM3_PHOPY|nr:protein hunchback [Photinus pyralis]XP_031345775.1 protein hunchback [Photinus pyralis]KAB0798556.1 hypothetical protein PPYR_09549 [Photinus pyralis]
MRGGVWDMSSTCIQGGLPRPLGGYQPNLIMEPHSPAPAWQMHHPIIPKQEPAEEERNDSGINSGSDFHSSSPGSENSQDYNSQNVQNPTTSSYYTTPLLPRVPTTSPLGYQVNLPMHFNYQSTSPSQDNASKPNFAPAASATENVENEDPLRKLQSSLEKNGLMITPTSPKLSEHSGDDENKSDMEADEYDEQGLRVPRMNSHGKVKTFKCKQCDFVAITKLDFWEHSKGHIKYDKLLTCPKCPFVTEYKHHLEYHLRNHFGSKPFKCDKCNYSCVNKSMLNSHMKSHSNVYQYRCAECSYATKYCHSLKLHLRKYSHKPAMVLNPDGTPNPLPIIDVYGTRRGPKQRSSQKQEEPETQPNILQNHLTHFMLNNTPQMQLPFPYHLLAGFPNPMANPLLFPPALANSADKPEERSPPMSPVAPTAEALDLSKPDVATPDQPSKNRRKGRAFKLETLPHTETSDDESTTELPAEKSLASPPARSPVEKDEVTNNNNHNFDCQYCNIAFGDIVLYTMHMGYHGFKDPFTCNMCGEQCQDKVSFFLHIARNPHT